MRTLPARAALLPALLALAAAAAPARAGSVLLNDVDAFGQNAFIHLDFEQASGQSTVAGVNEFLLRQALPAAFSQVASPPYAPGITPSGSLFDNDPRVAGTGFGGGVDGGAVSGTGYIYGGGTGQTMFRLVFVRPVDAVGFFLGGSLASTQGDLNGGLYVEVRFEDGTTRRILKSEVASVVPAVGNGAPSAHAINGFIGVDSNGGPKIVEASFMPDDDTQSIDDIFYGTATPAPLGGPGAQGFAESFTPESSSTPLPVSPVTPVTASTMALQSSSSVRTSATIESSLTAPLEQASNHTTNNLFQGQVTESKVVAASGLVTAQAKATDSLGSNHVYAKTSKSPLLAVLGGGATYGAEAEAEASWTEPVSIVQLAYDAAFRGSTSSVGVRLHGLLDSDDLASIAEVEYSLIYRPLGQDLDPANNVADRTQSVISFSRSVMDGQVNLNQLLTGTYDFDFFRPFELESTLRVHTTGRATADFFHSASIESFDVSENSLALFSSVLNGYAEGSVFPQAGATADVPEAGTTGLALLSAIGALASMRRRRAAAA